MNIAGRATATVLLATCISSSVGQVFSSNGVGYFNSTLKPGWNLICNPLVGADNTIGAMFKNVQGGTPDGLVVAKFVNGQYISAQYDAASQNFLPAGAATEETLPGDGVFVFLPGSADRVLTFVGQISQGVVSTEIPRGFSIKSSVIPQAISPDTVQNTDGSSAAIPATDGDVIYRFDPVTKSYSANSYMALLGQWDQSPLPQIKAGEAFYYFHTGASTTWNRTFSVNLP